MFQGAYRAAEAEVFGKVALIIVTPGMALHLYGKAASHGFPATRLMQQKTAVALIMDETQRCPAETYIALAINIRTMVAVGDCGQDLYDLQAQTCANQARPSFAAELWLARTAAAPGAHTWI